MSAFLGPIHYWLYNKILLQQAIVDDICSLGTKYGLSIKEECDDKYGGVDSKPLEEMIDHYNIHGWLQEKVSQAEYKYAYCVKTLLIKDLSLLNVLTGLLNTKGKELGEAVKETCTTAPLLFKVITDNLLDGMPCDHVNMIIENSDDRVVWKRSLCVHAGYWDEVGADISIYYRLREAWISGLAEECGYCLQKVNSFTYSIERLLK